MSIVEIKEGEMILARHIPAAAAWAEGLNFFSGEQEFIQVGTWGYDAGKNLKAHTHNQVQRQVPWTQEVLFIRRGRLSARIYNSQEELVGRLEVAAGDLIILLRGGHGYDILEDGTEVLEIKNGPYLGAEVDRRRL
jgi:hypothetical protein